MTIKEGWYYLLVVALLIVMLLHFKRESHAPFYATALLLVLNQLFSKDKRWGLKTIVNFLEVNGRTFVELVGILAGCGLLIGAFSMTGVVSSLANDLLRIAGDNAFLLLAMCAITSLVLGLGLTTTACYIFLAILVAPALEKLGLNKMAVHMFIFYWGMLSAITPPVAIASFAAAGIAGAPAMKTGWESMWVGSIIYFIPFFFVLNPALVLQGPSPWLPALGLTLLIGIGTLFICGGIQGYQAGIGDLRRAGVLEWPLRVLLVVGGFVLATPGGGIVPLSEWQMIGARPRDPGADAADRPAAGAPRQGSRAGAGAGRPGTCASGGRAVGVGLQRRVHHVEGGGGHAELAAERHHLAGEPGQLQAIAAQQVDRHGGHHLRREVARGVEQPRLEIGAQGNAAGAADGGAFGHALLEQGEHLRVVAQLAEGQARQRDDGAVGGEQDELLPQRDQDLVAVDRVEAGLLAQRVERGAALARAAVELAEHEAHEGAGLADDAGLGDGGADLGDAAHDRLRAEDGGEALAGVDAVLQGDDGGAGANDAGGWLRRRSPRPTA